jgi:hypothetical protein
LLGIPGISWVSLQHGDVAEEVHAVANQLGAEIGTYPGATNDMDSLAALIASLDCVVTVCNTTVHVAGAVGTPSFVLAPRVPLWLYGLRGATMPWYAAARMIRQTHYGDWGSVIEQAAHELKGFLAGR